MISPILALTAAQQNEVNRGMSVLEAYLAKQAAFAQYLMARDNYKFRPDVSASGVRGWRLNS